MRTHPIFQHFELARVESMKLDLAYISSQPDGFN